MVSLLLRQTGAALRMLLAATVVLGLVYPLAVWGVARLPGLHGPAEGSVLTTPDGTPNGRGDEAGACSPAERSCPLPRPRPSGSSLIGIDPVPANPAADPYFHTRPSASAQDVLGPGDPSTSGGSNQGGFSDKLLDQVQQRRTAIAAREGVTPEVVPADAVTASGSGIDPHISPAYTNLQVTRVARVTGLPETQVRHLVADATDGRVLGFLGEPGVNVTELNLAVAAAQRTAGN
jgi:potassium-transporting ATPase KdpC subunit